MNNGIKKSSGFTGAVTMSCSVQWYQQVNKAPVYLVLTTFKYFNILYAMSLHMNGVIQWNV